jgi:SAM-dependent methyltransferase
LFSSFTAPHNPETPSSRVNNFWSTEHTIYLHKIDGPPNTNGDDGDDLTIVQNENRVDMSVADNDHSEEEEEKHDIIISSNNNDDDNNEDDDEYDEDELFDIPFRDAFEDDTETFPYGTMSRVASHVTTLPSTTDAAILLSKTNSSTIFVDLGCGVGRVVNRVKERVPDIARCIGIDMCPREIDQAIAIAAAAAAAASNSPIGNSGNNSAPEFLVGDIFHAEKLIVMENNEEEDDWNNVVLFIFLIPTLVNSRGFQKLLQGFMDKGAKVVSYCYHPENWRIESRDERMNVNLYQGQQL